MESIPHNSDRLPGGRSRYEPETAEDLLKRPIAPGKQFVDGLLTEGATLLAGDAKAGKSFLALLLAVCCATGESFLGYEVPKAVGVLYLDLENGERITQARLRQLLDGEQKQLANLHIAYDWPKVSTTAGGLKRLEEYLAANKEVRVVIVDMLRNIRPSRKDMAKDDAEDRDDVYAGDHALMSKLNKFALEKRVALVVLHHGNKRPFDPKNPFQSMSGSVGMTGGVSANWFLWRPFGVDTGSLYIASREVEISDIPVQRDDIHGAWAPEETDSAKRKIEEATSAREQIRAVFKDARKPLSLSDLIEKTGPSLEKKTIRDAASKLERRGELIRKDFGLYEYIGTDASRLVRDDQTNPETLGGGEQEQAASVQKHIPPAMGVDASRLVPLDNDQTNPEILGFDASRAETRTQQSASVHPFHKGPDGRAYDEEHWQSRYR